MNIWIGNLPPEASDEEIKQLLVRHGFPEFSDIQRMPGDGTSPAALVGFEGVPREGLWPLVERLEGLYWKNRTLTVTLP